MSTTDANGIVFLEETDSVSPLHTLINGLQTGTSNAIQSLRKGPLYASNVTERNEHLTKYGSSAASPLWVNVAGALQWHDGSRWHRAGDTQIGAAVASDLGLAGTGWATVLSTTATTLGGPLTVRGMVQFRNANSGAYRHAGMRLVIGSSARPETVENIGLPFVSGQSPSAMATLEWPNITGIAAGSQTFALQAYASAASSVQFASRSLTVVERP